jgi:hypothetical protein
MEQFLELPMHQQDAETQKAYFDAIDEIEFQQSRGNKAAALNEFMAWALANAKLQELGKKTTASPIGSPGSLGSRADQATGGWSTSDGTGWRRYVLEPPVQHEHLVANPGPDS